MNLIDWILLFTPMITGFVTSMIWKVGSSAGANIPARPPPAVFGIVWPILYILMGLAWIRLRDDKENKLYVDIMFSIITFLLCLWIVTYYYSKRGGLYVILFCYLAVLLTIVYNNKNKNSMLIVPLLVWLMFATMLNYTEVNQVYN